MGKALAILEAPEDPSAQSFQIVGQAMEKLLPVVPLEKRLENVELAIAVIGQRGSGKGTVLSFMEQAGVCTAASSKGLREVARVILGRDAKTPELVAMGQRFKEELGYDVFIRMILHQMTGLPTNWWKQIAIDGLRTDEEIESFRRLFGDRARVLRVVRPNILSDEEGWRVVQQRQTKSGKVEYASFEDYVATQNIERSRIAALEEKADDSLNNTTDLEGLRKNVNTYLKIKLKI